MIHYVSRFKPIDSLILDRHSMNSLDRITNDFYDLMKDKTWKEFWDDFKVTAKNDPIALKNDIKKNYPVYTSMIVGNVSGAVGNYVSAHTATETGHSHKFIELISYAFEFGLHAVFSGLAYIVLSRVKGESWSKITTDVVSLAVVTTPLQFGVYAPARTEIADNHMNKGMRPDLATLLTQAKLLIPYMILAKTAFRYLASKVEVYFRPKIEKYFDKNKSLRNNTGVETLLPQDSIKINAGKSDLENTLNQVP